jgi:hypothetical protein
MINPASFVLTMILSSISFFSVVFLNIHYKKHRKIHPFKPTNILIKPTNIV